MVILIVNRLGTDCLRDAWLRRIRYCILVLGSGYATDS